MADPRHQLGRKGEERAWRELHKRGYRLVETNVRTPYGEIDGVFRHKKSLVFVEVKTRTSRAFGPPAAAVDADKQARLSRSALHWLSGHGLMDARARFDVVSVEYFDAGSKVSVITDAFELVGG